MKSNTRLPAADDLEEILLAIADVRSPLTVLSGRAQLLQRQIVGGRIHDPHFCLKSLETMHHAAQDLETRLGDLEQLVGGRDEGRNVKTIPRRCRDGMTVSRGVGPLKWSVSA